MMHFVLLLLLFPFAVGIYCPTGFTAINGQKCLQIFRNSLKHYEAESNCVLFGGTLVTIKNAVDNRAVSNLAASTGFQNIWIGIICFATGNNNITCYHDDGSGVVLYNNFAAGNPKVPGSCVYLSTSSGQWFSAPCEILGMPFICEVPPTVPDPNCVHNYNGYCYIPSFEMLTGTNTTTYPKAQALCQAVNANLVSIHSKQEVDYIRTIFRNSGAQRIFIGAEALLPEIFNWVDGSIWDYDYSDPLSLNSGNCLVMDLSDKTNSGLWSEIHCGMREYFMCKRKIVPVTSVGKMTTPMSSSEDVEQVNSNFQKRTPFTAALPHRKELLDFSNCNTTLLMAPGVITSLGYPNVKPPATFCTWTVAVLGPYRVGLYFPDFSTYNAVMMYDGYGNLITSRQGNLTKFSVLGENNIIKMTYDSSYDAYYGYTGFEATVLPY